MLYWGRKTEEGVMGNGGWNGETRVAQVLLSLQRPESGHVDDVHSTSAVI